MPDILIPAAIVGVFIIFDIVSGILQAISNPELSSEKLRQGAWHKMGLVLFVCLAYFIDYGTGYLDLGFNFPIVTPLCIYICITEVVSIVENITKMAPELKNTEFLRFFKSSELDDDDQKDNK